MQVSSVRAMSSVRNACAEGQQHLFPTARLRLLISEGWFKWRFLLRASTCGVPFSIDLRQNIEELLEPAMAVFQQQFTREAVDRARNAKMRCDVLVTHKNAKNRRAVCASLLAGSLKSLSLGQTLRHTCPCTPVSGKSLCSHHLAIGSDGATVIKDELFWAAVRCVAGICLKMQHCVASLGFFVSVFVT